MKKLSTKIIAALVCACSLAFQANAQTNITSGIGTISLTSITNTLTGSSMVTYGNGTTPYVSASGGTLYFNFSGTINNMSALTAGEQITIPITVAGASNTTADAHFPKLNMTPANIMNPNNTSQVLFYATYSGTTITLTATQAAVDYGNAFTFNLQATVPLNNNNNTTAQNNANTTVYTVGGSSFTLGNSPYSMNTGRSCITQTGASTYTVPNGSSVFYFGYQIFCLYNEMLNGELDPSSSALTSDVITTTTITPAAGSDILSVSWNRTPANLEVNQVIPGQDSISSNTHITAPTSPAFSTGDPTTLQPGQDAIVNNGDGTYTVTVNWGPLIGGYVQYPSGTDVTSTDNGASQVAVTDAMAAGLSAVDVRKYITITYADSTAKNTFTAVTTSNNSILGSSSTTITSSPANSNNDGQSIIKVYCVNLSGNSIQKTATSSGWSADNTANTPASLTVTPTTPLSYNGVTYNLVTDATILKTATGIPASTATTAVQTLSSSDASTIAYPNLGDTIAVYYVYEATSSLPITGLQLTAQPKGNTVELSWGTLTEINSKSFTVQRSADEGKTWVTVNVQPTKALNGNSSVPLSYTAQDIVLQSGEYEYRVVETDVDGSTNTSNTVMVTVTTNGSAVYPNPTKSAFNVVLPAGVSSATYRLISSDGKIVLSGTMTNAGNHGTISVAGIASGVYFLQVTVNNTTQTYEVQIQQ